MSLPRTCFSTTDSSCFDSRLLQILPPTWTVTNTAPIQPSVYLTPRHNLEFTLRILFIRDVRGADWTPAPCSAARSFYVSIGRYHPRNDIIRLAVSMIVMTSIILGISVTICMSICQIPNPQPRLPTPSLRNNLLCIPAKHVYLPWFPGGSSLYGVVQSRQYFKVKSLQVVDMSFKSTILTGVLSGAVLR